MTRTRLGRWFGAGDDCDRRRGQLSRYLDNDLRGKEATAMAAHLRGCTACRTEFEAMRAHRLILSAATIPRGAAGARARVLTRFEQSVRTQSAMPRPQSRPLPLRPAFAAVALIALAGGGTVFTFRSMWTAYLPTAPTAAAVSLATPLPLAPLSLPQSGELQALFAQHDGSVTASTATTKPIVTFRPVARPATARITTRHRLPVAANTWHSAETDTTQTVSDEPTPLPADEIPEAL